MGVWIVLLRGINVGGHRKVAMTSLRKTAEAAGFTDAATHVQSGNLVISAHASGRRDVEDALAAAIAKDFGFEVPVAARSLGDWRAIVRDNPFKAAAGTPKALHAFVLREPADAGAAKRIEARERSDEDYALIGETLYLVTPSGIGRSKFAASVERLLAVPATARNWNTVLKLEEMATSLAGT